MLADVNDLRIPVYLLLISDFSIGVDKTPSTHTSSIWRKPQHFKILSTKGISKTGTPHLYYLGITQNGKQILKGLNSIINKLVQPNKSLIQVLKMGCCNKSEYFKIIRILE